MDGEQRVGSVMITIGKVLLWMDFLLLIFVYVGLENGSHMWEYWVLGEGALGAFLMVMGAHMRGSLSA